MEIEVLRYDSKTKDYDQTATLKVESYKKIAEPKSLMAVRLAYVPIENGETDKDTEIIEIFKVLFIASCKTNLKQEFLAAFYINEDSELVANPITELSEGYHAPFIFLLDYKAYEDICDLTGESKKTFIEYFEWVKTGRAGVNSVIKYKGKHYAYDAQRELYDGLELQGK